MAHTRRTACSRIVFSRDSKEPRLHVCPPIGKVSMQVSRSSRHCPRFSDDSEKQNIVNT